MTDPEIVLATKPDFNSTAAEIESRLLSALAETNVQTTNETFALKIVSAEGGLSAGLTASTSYGWLLIKTLWVSETTRGKGLGRRLVAAAEKKATELNCANAWLDTSNPQAHDFYLRLGYEDFGRLENGPDTDPVDHRRWFMKKELTRAVERPA